MNNVCPECSGPDGLHSEDCSLGDAIDYPHNYKKHSEESKDQQDNETSDNDGTSKSEH